MIEFGHEEAFVELAAVALDSTSEEVSAAVRAHAAVCPECGPELAAMDATVAALGHLVPAAQINRGRSAGIRSRLIMRGRAERESQSAPAPGGPDLTRGVASLTGLGHKATPAGQRIVTGESRRVTPSHTGRQVDFEPPTGIRSINWWGIAATLAFFVTGAQLMRVSSERNSIRNQAAVVDTLAPVADSLEAMVARKDAMIAVMTGPDVKVVPLTNRSAREPLGKMMWNRASNDWVMVTYGLKQPREGMTYQVWLITDDARISAGTFRPDSKGNTMMQANYALPREALRSVAVTEEPEGGVSSPTGPMIIAGSA
jgi:hypothetical protein